MTPARSYRTWGWLLLVGVLVLLGSSAGWAATNTYPWPPDGPVGIGTSTPTSTLHIVSPNATVYSLKIAQPRTLMLSQYTNTSAASIANQVGFDYRLNTDGAERTASRLISGFTNVADATRTSYIAFANNDNGAFVETARFVGRNLGIGTATPTARLHVEGDAFVKGNIAAKYQDVAEWVPAKSALAPGTVVIIDPTERNQVLPAATPYDTRVAGVVSAQPGLLLGEAGDDKAKIAHSGRVPVKVDASFGPIAVGDLLVTSPTPGYAMRSTPVDLAGVPLHRPGTLVGKALEPLAAGQGEILVLLTLQ